MTELSSTYSKSELGWVSDSFTLTGDIYLYVTLKEKGIIIIKKKNDADSENPKISISSNTTDAEYLIKGESCGKILEIVTSTEPSCIKYENV